MKAKDYEAKIKENEAWLSEDNRLHQWNHLRYRCGLADLTLEQAAQAMLDKKINKDIREYLSH